MKITNNATDITYVGEQCNFSGAVYLYNIVIWNYDIYIVEHNIKFWNILLFLLCENIRSVWGIVGAVFTNWIKLRQ